MRLNLIGKWRAGTVSGQNPPRLLQLQNAQHALVNALLAELPLFHGGHWGKVGVEPAGGHVSGNGLGVGPCDLRHQVGGLAGGVSDGTSGGDSDGASGEDPEAASCSGADSGAAVLEDWLGAGPGPVCRAARWDMDIPKRIPSRNSVSRNKYQVRLFRRGAIRFPLCMDVPSFCPKCTIKFPPGQGVYARVPLFPLQPPRFSV